MFDMLKEYKAYLEDKLCVSKSTYDAYVRDVSSFLNYVDISVSHDIRDVKKLVNIILNHLGKAELEEGFFETPFEEPPLMFDWNVPE